MIFKSARIFLAVTALRIRNKTRMDKTGARTTMWTHAMCCVPLQTVSDLEVPSRSCSQVLLTTKRLSRARSGPTCHPQMLTKTTC